MPLSPDQLDASLTRGLAPIYLIFGPEPLQLGEAAAAVRAAARQAGFTEREVLETGRDFDWSHLAGAVGTLSLFASQRLIELRLDGDKVGQDGSAALRAQAERPSRDVLLLILAPGLDWKALKSKWAEAIGRVGVIVQVREPQGRQLAGWLAARLRRAGFQPTPDAVALLAERVEGNLLAADQEIGKLRLLRAPGPLDAEGLLAAVADSARYSLFDLADAALAADRARVHRILQALAAEDTAPPLLLWVLAREVRKLAAIAFAQAHRQDLKPIFTAYQVWDSRRPAALAASARLTLARLWPLVERCAAADLAIKGRGPGDPWTLLTAIAEGLAAPPLERPRR